MKLNISEATEEAKRQGVKVVRNVITITDLAKKLGLTENYQEEQLQAEQEARELVDPAEVEVMPDEENTLSEEELEKEEMLEDCIDYLWLLKDEGIIKRDIQVLKEGLRFALRLCDEITGDYEGVTENDD